MDGSPGDGCLKADCLVEACPLAASRGADCLRAGWADGREGRCGAVDWEGRTDDAVSSRRPGFDDEVEAVASL
jgi:hypothetical protein